MKIGDLVKYRSWRKGDEDPSALPKTRRGWDQHGVILDIGDWKLGSLFAPGESLLVYTFAGEFCEWRSIDAEVISKTKINRDSGECSYYKFFPSCFNNNQL